MCNTNNAMIPSLRRFTARSLAFLLLSLPILAGCSSSPRAKSNNFREAVKDRPETVLVTYHVKPGMEKKFEALLKRAWDTYRSEGLVKSEPHLIVRDGEEGDTVGYVEIFTWVSHTAAQKAPDSVKKIWGEEHALCEARAGRTDIGGGEVQLVVH
jgi:hypothetical protein